MPGKCCESLHTISTNVIEATSLRNLLMRPVPSRVGRWQRRCRRTMPREQARIGVFRCGGRPNERVLSRGACDHTRSLAGTLGVDAPDHEKAITSISRRFSRIASRASRATLSAEREASPLPCTIGQEASKMAQQRSQRVWLSSSHSRARRTQALRKRSRQQPTEHRDQADQSAAALAQQASNPFASSWALQLQQNNNWAEMPRGDDHTRVQSNLLFQPLISLRLTEKQGLIVRPWCQS